MPAKRNEDKDEDAVEVIEVDKIENGNMLKMKQLLDEGASAAISSYGYKEDFYWDNFKLALMAISCIFALVGQFYPMPFPDSRLLLAICCAGYFIFSTILQGVVTYIDKDTIMITKPSEKNPFGVRVRADFPRFHEYYKLTLEPYLKDGSPDVAEVSEYYVGDYFTVEGEFYLEGYKRDVQKLVSNFENKISGLLKKKDN